MSEKEYYLILPLLIYGIGIAELVSSWRNLFIKERRHLPYLVASLLLLEVAFWNFYKMVHWMTDDYFKNYLSYLLMLAPPLLFLFVVAVFVPDRNKPDVNLKEYFKQKIPVIFGGLALFTSLHFLFDTESSPVPRLVAVGLLLTMAIWRKEWIIYLLLVLRVTTWFIVN